MDLYACGQDFQIIRPVNTFSSLVWTERYSASGDCVVTAPATDENYELLTEDNFLRLSDSDELMLIDDVNIKKSVMTVKGISLLEFLKQRFFRETWQAGQTQGLTLTDFSIYEAINTVIRYAVNPGLMFQQGLVLTNIQSQNETFDDLVISDAIPFGDNPTYSLVVPRGDVYTVIKNLADSDSLGLRLIANPNRSSSMVFSTYRGLDRTGLQTRNTTVILDPNNGDLTDVETLRSKKTYKNVCYVWPSDITSQDQIATVYFDGAKNFSRFNRRTMTVEASNIKASDYTSLPQLLSALRLEGINALINNNYIQIVDGKIGANAQYLYGRDYNLGDILELRNHAGNVRTPARVTEYIRSQDSNGVSAYPTLSVIS